MTQYTPNLNLDLYESTDKPNLRDQYNSAMGKIDTDLSTPFTSNRLADGAVTSSKLYDEAVTNSKIANGAVTSAKIADGTISTNDIADGAVTSDKLAVGAIATADIADGAVTSDKIADGAIATADIADSAITSAKIANGTIATVDIANGAVTRAKLANPVIVIFGDSWTDESVAASRWVEKLRNEFPNATIKNYAKNGCHHLNSSFETMYGDFISDTSFDKSTITHAVLVYGVNDQYTYPIASTSDEATVIKNFYDAVTASGQIPSDIDIQWVINHSYGILSNSWSIQYEYWLRVIQNLNVACPRLIPHESMSWFNASEYNNSNWFHLTQSCQEGHFFKNMKAIIFGGTLIKYPTVHATPSSPHNGFNIYADILGSSLVYNFDWESTNAVINGYAETINQPIPEKIDVFLPIPCGNNADTIPANQFAHFKVENAGTYMTTFTDTIGATGSNITAGAKISCTYKIQGF